jgi:hypothetical protein
MSLKRTAANVALGLSLLLLATPAFGQALRGLQLFDTPDLTTVGRGQKANEGFFFSYDGLYWNISPPNVAVIGKEGLTRTVFYGPHPLTPLDQEDDSALQTNTLDTSELSSFQGANWVGGQRFEGGRMLDGHGWLISFTELQNQTSNITAQNANMVLEDPAQSQQGHSSLQGIVGQLTQPDGTVINIVQPLPVTFNAVNMINNTGYWSIEWMYVGRSDQLHHGGYLEWFAGPRYTELNDTFLVNATGGILDATRWATDAQNHLVAGQIGARYFRKVGRWMFDAEGRFFGGINYQNIHQFGTIASNSVPPGGLFQPLTLSPVAFSHAEFMREWTPGIELRLEMRYQMTRGISLRAGWSGTWMDNIARAQDMVDYTLPSFGIITTNNRQGVILNGAVIGIDINR